jgi:RNAse (barnase) inhibitor barstar
MNTNAIVTVKLDGSKFLTWKNFHSYFQKKFGFPEFYGRNMNAWIDCMADLDKPENGMTNNFPVTKGQMVVLRIVNVEELRTHANEIYIAIMECTALINFSRMQSGDLPLLILAF